MIQANELRIGNIFVLDNKKHKIISISKDRIKSIIFDQVIDFPIYETYIEYKSIQPIPLTEDILLKCGFNWIGLGGMVKDNYFIRHEGCLTMCMKSGVLLTTVHQLQNLYFALTKQELEIKL